MNISRYILVLFLWAFNTQSSHGGYKILAIMPFNGKSHFYFAEVLFEALAKRGNKVTVLSHFPKNKPFKNYHDISMATEGDDGIHKIDMEKVMSKSTLSGMMELFGFGVEMVCRQGLSHPNVQKLLKSEDHYDLIITEMFNTDCFLGFVHKFKAPHVHIRTSTLSVWLSDRTGNPDNPSYIPGTTTGNPSRMSFLERLHNTVYYFIYKAIYAYYDRQCDAIARQHFGDDMPSLQDIAKNTSLYLINTHFLYQYAKPLLPNVKEIAGLHVKDTRPLPDDLENWISGATHGLIYFNLGSMLRTSTMAHDKKLAFLNSFAQLPHRVLMKWETKETIDELPDNVKLVTWASQNDILHHSNVKLFITHGGMLGTVEAVHAGVPMIVIPFYGDQLTNAALLQERGLAIHIKYADVSFDLLNRTLHTILYDSGYAKHAKEMSIAFRDRPIPPLTEAVYWIEYIARNRGKGTEGLLRSPVLDLPIYQYLLLDILGLFIFGLFIVWLAIRLLIRPILKLMLKTDCQRKYKEN